jgi:hypothetical protein
MKSKYFLVFILTTLLTLIALAGTSCFDAGYNKTTGGGWFYNTGLPGYPGYNPDSTQKITFGFNAQPVGDPTLGNTKGDFQLVDHDNKINIHGTFTSTNRNTATTNGLTQFLGTAQINGQKFNLNCVFYDASFNGTYGALDGVVVYADNDVAVYAYGGVLGGGNIKLRKEK